jgi:hypothetical protein
VTRLALAALVSALAGCVVVPLPPHDPTQAAVGWLVQEAGAASRAQLLLRLGEPDQVADEERVLIYRWHDPRLLVLLAGNAPGAVGGFEIEKEFDLVLRLDDRGRLVSHEVADVTGLPGTGVACTASGICVEGMGTPPPALLADAARVEERSHLVFEASARPEAVEPLAGSCRVLFFPADIGPASVWVDGRLIGFGHQGGWLAATLAPGKHRAAVLSPQPGPDAVEAAHELELDCLAGSRSYLVQQTVGFVGIAAGALEAHPQPPVAPQGGWRRYVSVEPAAH